MIEALFVAQGDCQINQHSEHQLDALTDQDHVFGRHGFDLGIDSLEFALDGLSDSFFGEPQHDGVVQLQLNVGVPVNVFGDNPGHHEVESKRRHFGEHLH